ncbi:kinase-like domain-containing protein [Tanacetum coccineum]
MNSPQAMIFSSSSSLIYFLFYGLAITSFTSATVSASYGGNETDYHALLSFKSMITHDPNKVLNLVEPFSFLSLEWYYMWKATQTSDGFMAAITRLRRLIATPSLCEWSGISCGTIPFIYVNGVVFHVESGTNE